MQDFLQFNLGHLLTIGSFIVIIAVAFGRLTERLRPVEAELVKLREVIVALAKQEERMLAMDQRMLAQGKRFDELYSIVMKRIIEHKD